MLVMRQKNRLCAYLDIENSMVKTIFIVTFFLFAIKSVYSESLTIRIDYLGTCCFETNKDKGSFYEIFDKVRDSSNTCFIKDSLEVTRMLSFLDCEEPSSKEDFVWPAAMLIVMENDSVISEYEVNALRMKKVGGDKIYKVSMEFWSYLLSFTDDEEKRHFEEAFYHERYRMYKGACGFSYLR